MNAAGWPDRLNWQALAACRGADPVLFFRGDYESLPYANNRYIAARTYCDRCPVTAECAVAGRSEHYGLWGGKSPNERWPHRPQAATT